MHKMFEKDVNEILQPAKEIVKNHSKNQIHMIIGYLQAAINDE